MKKFELSFVQEALDRLVAEGFTGILVAQPDERLLKFAEVRLPQLIAQLKESRDRYFASLSET